MAVWFGSQSDLVMGQGRLIGCGFVPPHIQYRRIICLFAGCRYVDNVLAMEREKMKCCSIEFRYPTQTSQTFVYGGILIAGFLVYFLVIFFSNPVR